MKKLLAALSNRTPLGWLQLKHDITRLLTAMSGIAFADILIFMQFGFLNALMSSNTLLHENLQADIVIMNTQALNWSELSTFSRRRLYQALDVPGIASAEALYVNSVRWKNPQTQQKTSVMVIGMNPDRQAFMLPEITQKLNEIKLPDTVLFDRAARGEYEEAIAQTELGETVTTEIERRTVTIGGLFAMGASFAADAVIVTSDQNFLRLMPKRQAGAVSLGLLRVEPGSDPMQVKEMLTAHLPDDVQTFTLEEFINKEKTYWATNRPVGIVFGFGAAIGFIVGVVIVYQILSTDVNAHMAEYATFKAMGYRNSYLLGVVFEEALILAAFGFFPGLGISMGLYALAQKATALPMLMTVNRAIGVFILTLVMCGISGAIATRRLQAADPADIF
jgi:putative ABC transport system permease protein